MPKLKSSHKRLRTNLKARMRNKAVRTRMRGAIKQVHQASDQTSAQAALDQAISVIDRTVKKGVIHKNTGARYKSRLSRRVRTMA